MENFIKPLSTEIVYLQTKLIDMSDWFTVKIKFFTQQENGSINFKTESYMLNAMTFTEAEARLLTIMTEYIPEYELLACVKTKVSGVIIDETQEKFFKAKLSFVSADPDGGKEKKVTENYIIQADGLIEAYQKLETRMAGSIVDWEIPSISQINITDVFPYVDEAIVSKEEELEEAE